MTVFKSLNFFADPVSWLCQAGAAPTMALVLNFAFLSFVNAHVLSIQILSTKIFFVIIVRRCYFGASATCFRTCILRSPFRKLSGCRETCLAIETQ